MTEEALQQLKYPVGIFLKPEIISEEQKNSWIDDIEQFPFFS